MTTYLRWCHGCEGRSDPLGEYPDDRTCTRCGSEDTMVERVDREDPLLAMDEAHDSDSEFYYSDYLKAELLRREEEAARRGVGDVSDAERGDR